LESVALVSRMSGALDLPLFLLLAAPITFYDLREYRIPDVLSVGGILAFTVLRLLPWRGPHALWEPAIACAVGFGSFRLIRALTGGKLGRGDAKYSALIAAAAGLRGWFVAMCVASVTGLLCAAVMVGAFGADRQRRFPFAPFLSLGGALAVALRGGL
jgi:prepilin signal peptidase PulO-like enzyme (type II secretory pathway)